MRNLFLVLFVTLCAASFAAELPAASPLLEVTDSEIGYPTVQAAFDAIRAKPGVQIQEEQGWTTIKDRESESVFTIWSFAQAGRPAYPSAVKRTLYQEDGHIFIKMHILCQAAKGPCDAVVRDFQALNDQIKDELQHRRK